MSYIYREKVLTSTDLYWYVTLPDGTATDVNSITYEIISIDINTGDETQVQPPTSAVNFGTGKYYANWTVPVNETLGSHKIVWRWKLSATSLEQTDYDTFEVLDPTSGNNTLPDTNPLYVSIDEMRQESFCLDYTDDEIKAIIFSIQEYIEKETKQFFNKRDLILTLNGSDTQILVFDIPIISITKIEFKINNVFVEQSLSNFDIYNRFWPDDRDYPKIEIIDNVYNTYNNYDIFPEGKNNIRVTGSFGYVTENLGTPSTIKMVVKMLFSQWSGSITDTLNKIRSSKIKKEKAANYEIEMSDSSSSNSFSGDSSIDALLRSYTRSTSVSSI